jgi:hypothetical protein
MTTTRTESILSRHRYRPLLDLAAPLLLLAAVALTGAGVGTAGKLAPRADSHVDELPARAECVHLAGADTSPT